MFLAAVRFRRAVLLSQLSRLRPFDPLLLALLAFFRLGSDLRTPGGRNTQLQYVRYVLEQETDIKEETEETKGEYLRLVRYDAPVVLDAAVGKPTKSVLLNGLASVEFSYLSGRSWKDVWHRTDKLPRAIRVEGERHDKGRDRYFRFTVAIRASEFFDAGD